MERSHPVRGGLALQLEVQAVTGNTVNESGVQGVGLEAVADDAGDWGAAQLQNRFRRGADRAMRPVDYQAWVAVRAIGEAVTRLRQADPREIGRFMLGPDFNLAAFKGVPLTFRGKVNRLSTMVRGNLGAALQGFLALKGRITLDTKLVVTVGDLAYLSNTWSLSGTGPDGTPVTLGATTAEAARRQADGTWRYVIDNAWGDRATTGSP
jgi:hypothetical protein